jgi:hypothetical protein
VAKVLSLLLSEAVVAEDALPRRLLPERFVVLAEEAVVAEDAVVNRTNTIATASIKYH